MCNRREPHARVAASAARLALVWVVLLTFALPVRAEEEIAPKPPIEASIGEPVEIPEEDRPKYEPVIRYDADGNPIDPCRKFDANYDSWLDRSQVGLFRTVCNTGAWFDGFFGNSRFDQKTGDTFGRLSTGFFYDRRDDFDPNLRLRANFALAAARNRASLFIESGDDGAVVEGRGRQSSERAVDSLSRNQDTALFAGFGFDRRRDLERGFSFRLGLKFGTPVEQFAKATYRYGWRASDTLLLRIRPVVYWKSEERFGATLGFQTDKYLGQRFLLRWDNSGNISEDEEVEGVRWNTGLILFHALSASRAFTYSVFVEGETDADVELQDLGFQVKYRHRFLRDWLFLEYLGSASWPREELDEEREFNPGAGIRFEVYFGGINEPTLR